MENRKPAVFLASSKKDLLSFPVEARREAGHQLDLIQRGEDPDDFKPMNTVGRGVYEIRIRKVGRAHRVFYVAKFEEAVYVLHAFEKKTHTTSPGDLETGRKRFRDLIKQRG